MALNRAPFGRRTLRGNAALPRLALMIGLFNAINKGLSDVGGATAPSIDVISHLKDMLLEHKYKLYIQPGPW